MAVEIVGNAIDVKRYRDLLHKQGTYTKRFGKDIGSGLILPKHDDYRVLKGSFQPTKKTWDHMDGSAKAFDVDRPVDIQGVANQNAVDRTDERLEPAGVDIENFKSNNVLLVDHLYFTRAVVGSVNDVLPEDDGVKFTASIGQPDLGPLTDTQLEVRSLVAQKLLKTVSVGFIPHKIRAPEFGTDGKLVEPAVILAWELLELSIVAVPANAGSTFEMRSMGSQGYKGYKASAISLNNKRALLDKPLTGLGSDCKTITNTKAEQDVQTLIFSKAIYSQDEAVEWAKKNEFRTDKIEQDDDNYMLRQLEANKFDSDSLRTIEMDKGIKAIVGILKPDLNNEDEKELAGMDEVLEALSELVGLVKSQTEMLKELTTKGSDEEEEEEEKAIDEEEEEEKPKDDEEEDEEDEKAIIADAIKSLKASSDANALAITNIADVVRELLEKG